MPSPLGSKNPGKEIYVEGKNLRRAYNTLFGQVMPASKENKEHFIKSFSRGEKKVRWMDLILIAETLGFSAGQVYTLLHNHFRGESMSKRKVAWLNPTMVQQLFRKINKWGGVPKTWKNHRTYIDAWCKLTNTPLFKSLSNFQDLVTAWKDATVGKRGWRSIAKEMNIDSSGDKEFSIHNKPPKSLN